MRKILSILASTLMVLILAGCDDSTGSSKVQTKTSAPITFSYVVSPDSLAKYAQDTIVLDMGLAKGLHGFPMPSSDPALGYAIGGVGDTVCLMIPDVPEAVKWEVYMGEEEEFNRLSTVLYEIIYDTLPSLLDGHNTLLFKMVARKECANIQGFAANRYGDVADSYYANINYCFGVLDSLYFETDAPVWELSAPNPLGQTFASVHLSGKTNALRAEVHTWGYGLSQVHDLTIEDGTFDASIFLGITGSLDNVKTKIYLYGSEHGYETIDISSGL